MKCRFLMRGARTRKERRLRGRMRCRRCGALSSLSLRIEAERWMPARGLKGDTSRSKVIEVYAGRSKPRPYKEKRRRRCFGFGESVERKRRLGDGGHAALERQQD